LGIFLFKVLVIVVYYGVLSGLWRFYMYYKDLDPYITFSGDIEEGVFNVGWLDVGYEFN
jgi:hypothetical protein